MRRYTRKDIDGLMEVFCTEIGLKFGKAWPREANTVYIEHNATYGGYRVCRYVDYDGHIGSWDLSDHRYTPKELAEHISFALTMFRAAKREEERRPQ